MRKVLFALPLLAFGSVEAQSQAELDLRACIDEKISALSGAEDPVNLTDAKSVRLRSCRSFPRCSSDQFTRLVARISADEGKEILAESLGFTRTSKISGRAKIGQLIKSVDNDGNITSASVTMTCKRERNYLGGGCGVGGVIVGIAVPIVTEQQRTDAAVECALEMAGQ